MSDYTPKRGDSVKLTAKANPENVLFGAFDNIDMHRWGEFVPDGNLGLLSLSLTEWTIEPWVKPMTFKPFAVVQLPENWNKIIDPLDEYALPSAIVCRGLKTSEEWVWTDAWGDVELLDSHMTAIIANGGKVVFEGVDENANR